MEGKNQFWWLWYDIVLFFHRGCWRQWQIGNDLVKRKGEAASWLVAAAASMKGGIVVFTIVANTVAAAMVAAADGLQAIWHRLRSLSNAWTKQL
jgi:hypothetical protein